MEEKKLNMGELIFLNNIFQNVSLEKIDDEDLLTIIKFLNSIRDTINRYNDDIAQIQKSCMIKGHDEKIQAQDAEYIETYTQKVGNAINEIIENETEFTFKLKNIDKVIIALKEQTKTSDLVLLMGLLG